MGGVGARAKDETVARRGILFVVSSPSGAGKTTLTRTLIEKEANLNLSVSVTTRARRPSEIDGVHYRFISTRHFEAMRAGDELLEWAEVHGNCYGTPRRPVETQIQQGNWVVLEIELQGARQIRRSFPQALQIFILPPSLEELEHRLRRRGQDPEEAIARRLKRAQAEIEAASEFDVQVMNDNLQDALEKIELAIFSPVELAV
ncbi:MAG: guanylate kinase [Leptolyngbyaceae cyanobacterium SL_7_1]|nr:guanylate kinase [Leptolyngbyaceae cyanobacterium SL_7_1]